MMHPEDIAMFAKQRAEKLTEILAEFASTFPGGVGEDDKCIHCFSRIPFGERHKSIINEEYHSDDCLWLRANKTLREYIN